MGLDQFAKTLPYAPNTPVDFEIPEDDAEEIFYWRKHPNLHGWFEALYRQKGGKDEAFNVVPVQVTAADIDQLEADVLGEHLPETTGFFFGQSSRKDRDDDLQFIAKARGALADGKTLFYYAWY